MAVSRSGEFQAWVRTTQINYEDWGSIPVGAPFTWAAPAPGLTPLRLKSLSVVYALVRGRWAAEDLFNATAARNQRHQCLFIDRVALMEIDGPRVLPSRLGLNRPEGSSNNAPLAKVIFTTFLYVSPVQIMPACDHTGTPRIEFDFHLLDYFGVGLLDERSEPSEVSPRQSLRSLILASIS